ncbi:polysaccharide lyase [Glaciecola sp. SC05]|uniref:polysaccharide lyase n=1 Tax=Glaciecola sp. SC05 TaxID=1987355 RepID=UPI0035277773
MKRFSQLLNVEAFKNSVQAVCLFTALAFISACHSGKSLDTNDLNANNRQSLPSKESSAHSNLVFAQNFEQLSLGAVNDKQLKALMPSVEWSNLNHHVEISKDPIQGQVLRVRYPKDGVGPRNSGGQFNYRVPPKNEYTLSYKLFFEEGFEFVLGGKLPGLTSGGETYTGGVHPTEGQGWSARYMWRKEGKAMVYLYYVENKGPWGENLVLKDIKFQSGQWYEITQRIKLNDPDSSNAELQVWINGKPVLDKRNFRLRIGEQGKINSLYFSTFFGGSKAEWAPSKDVYIRFDDFKLL